MSDAVQHILSLPKAERLRIAMEILRSIQQEESPDAEHSAELQAFQARLEAGEVAYYSEDELWAELRKRTT